MKAVLTRIFAESLLIALLEIAASSVIRVIHRSTDPLIRFRVKWNVLQTFAHAPKPENLGWSGFGYDPASVHLLCIPSSSRLHPHPEGRGGGRVYLSFQKKVDHTCSFCIHRPKENFKRNQHKYVHMRGYSRKILICTPNRRNFHHSLWNRRFLLGLLCVGNWNRRNPTKSTELKKLDLYVIF